MTRNQEIEKAKAAIFPIPKGGRSYEAAIWCSGFDFGAEWADSHPKNQWHDLVKNHDDLPKHRQTVLVCIGSENYKDVAVFYDEKHNGRNVFFIGEEIYYTKEVIAWMPIPEFKEE